MTASAPPSFDERLDAVEKEADRLAEVAQSRFLAPVPSCPEWLVRDLLDHLSGVLGFWTVQVAAADPDKRHEFDQGEDLAGQQLIDDLLARARDLNGALRHAGPESPCWNWSGRDLSANWVARRMSLEIAVHRYDGELSAGETTEVPLPLAVDGLAERIYVHLSNDVADEPEATLGGSLCLACTDADAAFVVEVARGRLHVRDTAGPASAFVRAPASDLFLFSWNRLPLERLSVTGDREVAAAWASLPV